MSRFSMMVILGTISIYADAKIHALQNLFPVIPKLHTEDSYITGRRGNEIQKHKKRRRFTCPIWP